ncbi:hypothetical protein C8R14_12352 [Nitrosomonas eutropha]|uniref:Uncharacterized protein n=1 Tax=Nitrosomonas eutropha TaxID=916 RepID=A0ABX5M5G2_9PROT|nr:hypothetical protein C8R14_12352 [Nitrosomonas eutropha]
MATTLGNAAATQVIDSIANNVVHVKSLFTICFSPLIINR